MDKQPLKRMEVSAAALAKIDAEARAREKIEMKANPSRKMPGFISNRANVRVAWHGRV